MKVVLFDRTEYVVSAEAGKRLKRALSDTSASFVTINGDMIRKSAIALVKAGGFSEADMVRNDPNKRLGGDSRSEKDQHQAARKASDIARENLRKKGMNV